VLHHDAKLLETRLTLKSDQPKPPGNDTPASPDSPSPPTEAQRAQREQALKLAEALARAADSKKAEDIVILDVSRALGIADFFVIATARSRRQVTVVADACEQVARGLGSRARALEGTETGWVVGDFVDVVVHVFEENLRGFYDLEHLWADAPRMAWTPEPSPLSPGTPPA
jgi:ribosome-associated protein